MRNARLPQLHRALQRVVRRERIALAIDRGARFTAVSAGLAISLTVVDRLFDLGLPVWLIMAVAVIGLPGGAISALLHRFDLHALAARLDHEFSLEDRLSTALELETRSARPRHRHDAATEEGFAELVCIEAEGVTREVDPSRAVRFEWNRFASTALVVLFMAGLLSTMLPSMSGIWQSDEELQRLARLEQRRSQAASAIREAAQQIESLRETDQDAPGAGDGESADRASEVMRDLDRLASQLTAESDDEDTADDETDESIAEAADKLDSLADELESQARMREQARDEIIERFSGLSDGTDESAEEEEFERSEAYRDFIEAMRSGRLSEAADRLADADREIRQKSPEEREALAKRLREMAEQLERAQARDEQVAQSEQDDVQKTLEDAGINPEEAKALAEHAQDREELERKLQEQQQIDPTTARELARRLDEQRQREQAEKLADEKTRETAERMREWADSIERDQQPPPQEQSTQPEQPQPESPQQQSQQSQQRDSTRDQQGPQDQTQPPPSQTGEQGQRQSTEQQQQQQQQQDGDQQQTGEQQAQSQDQAEGQKEGQPQAQQQEGQGTEQQATPVDQPGVQPQPQPGQPDGTQQQGEQAQQTGREGARQQPETPGERPAETPSARDLQRALREVENLRRSADRDRQVSEEMRERARRLVEEMSPEEREQLERWARDMQQQQQEQRGQRRPGDALREDDSGEPGTSGRSGQDASERAPGAGYEYQVEDIDARPENVGEDGDRRETVLSEWYRDREADEAIPESGAPSISRPGADQAPGEVRRQANRAIERALSEEAVAPRYRDLLKRWSHYFSQQAERAREGKDSASSSGDNQ